VARKKAPERKFDALPDTVDFRDVLYRPSLIAVAQMSDMEGYRAHSLPVLDQGSEGACTGYGLATVANYLLRVRGKVGNADPVSPWMLYTMAKRYDEWPGEDYDGSSARGAMKGWHKHGLCAQRLWKDHARDRTLNEKRAADAIERPLGAYFRVNHKDLVAMHAAISEVGILYATCIVHEGWQAVGRGDREIEYREGGIGGHAFAIVGYDRESFWIQNSWGEDWGEMGLARLSYEDWLANGTDVWVAALGAPVWLGHQRGPASMMAGASRSYESTIYSTLRPHIVTARNDGQLDDKGTYGLSKEGLRDIIQEQFPARTTAWRRKRIVLHAHGGLTEEASAVQYVAGNRDAMLQAEAYPVSFIWRSDAWSTLRNILQEALSRRRDEGLLDAAKDFMLDRLDDTLEPLARVLGGKAMWDEMKENARLASANARGAARMTADHLIALSQAGKLDEIHLVGHSAGSILLAPLAQRFAEQGLAIDSLTLWAPACTMELFERVYRPLIEAGSIRSFDLYTLDDATERDDTCAGIYHKSLLYLVSAAFEEVPRIPLIRDGVPLLGLTRDVSEALPDSFWRAKARNWHIAPNPGESGARHHGDFDNDPDTLRMTLERITGQKPGTSGAVRQPPAAAARRRRRQGIETALRRA
jgi:pimeloyl-ACP methyl ester carboxylesterase